MNNIQEVGKDIHYICVKTCKKCVNMYKYLRIYCDNMVTRYNINNLKGWFDEFLSILYNTKV